MTTWDAVVVGAGPAGSIAARQLARAGVSVLLVDRQRFPRWKVCGGCLGPAALRLLDSVGLGALPIREGAIRLERLALAAGGRRARIALRGTVALSRVALDGALVDAAVGEGVEFRDGVRVDLGGRAEGGVELELRTDGDASREQAR
ncbi:MAG: FAD-dependent monooxygenase, partial [Gemmatimonadetes bacterium]|nr:FAD-dependent monooxygenase [Gemmatimonadota bacterium]